MLTYIFLAQGRGGGTPDHSAAIRKDATTETMSRPSSWRAEFGLLERRLMTWKRIRRCQCERMRTRAGGAESRKGDELFPRTFTARHARRCCPTRCVYGLQLRRLRMLLKYKVGVGAPAQKSSHHRDFTP